MLMHSNSAVMQINCGLDEIKPNAGADDPRDIATAMIPLEQMRDIARGNSDAVVRDCDHGLLG